jgi:arylsulfatase A-like enzyme
VARLVLVLWLWPSPAVAAAVAEPGARSDATASGRQRPDLVLILVDALRADRLSVSGYGRPTTPRLDRRRSELRWFTDAVTHATHTVPSVASLFVGVPPRLHKIQWDPRTRSFPPNGQHPRLETSLPTLPEVLSAAGYDTRAFVGNPWITEENRFNRGFGVFEGWRAWDRDGTNDDKAILETVASVLEASSERPRFVYAHLMSVHSPYDKGHRELVREMGVDRFVNGLREASPRDITFMSDVYDSDVLYVDGLVGGLLDALSARAGSRPVAVCVFGDHGEEFHEHGGFGHNTTLFQELVQVPVLFWGPGLVDRTGPSDYPFELIDVRRIFTALAGVSDDAAVGLVSSVLPAPPTPGERLRAIELDAQKALYLRPWKYIVTREPFEERLYNLAVDGTERVNRVVVDAEMAAKLRTIAQRLWPELPYPAVDPAAPSLFVRLACVSGVVSVVILLVLLRRL